MMVVSHEMGFAKKVANRVVFMDQGESWKMPQKTSSLEAHVLTGSAVSVQDPYSLIDKSRQCPLANDCTAIVEVTDLRQTAIDSLSCRLVSGIDVTAVDRQFRRSRPRLFNKGTPPVFPSIFESAQKLRLSTR